MLYEHRSDASILRLASNFAVINVMLFNHALSSPRVVKSLPYVHIVIAMLALLYMQKPFFYPGDYDGFTVGMRYVAAAPWQEWTQNPLYWVHIVRFIAVWPFWLVKDTAIAPLFNAVGMMAILWPLATTTLAHHTRAHPLRSVLFYLPIFVSFRSILVVAGVGYMFLMYFRRLQSAPVMFLSVLFANLSSASLAVWLLGMLVQGRKFAGSLVYYGVVALAMLSISASLSHKIPYFGQVAVQAESLPSVAIEHKIQRSLMLIEKIVRAAVDRNTILISLKEGNTLRALFYIAILAALIAAILRCLQLPILRWNIGLFLILCGPVFLLEGLGVVCLIAPLIILLSELREGHFLKDYSIRQPAFIVPPSEPSLDHKTAS